MRVIGWLAIWLGLALPVISEPGTLVTPGGRFDLLRSAPLDDGATRYFVVQTDPDADVWPTLRPAIEQAGGRVLGGLPLSAAIVRLTPEARASVERAVGVIAVVPYAPAFKVDPGLYGRAGTLRLELTLFPDAALQLPDEATLVTRRERSVVVRADASAIERLAALDGVYAIHERSARALHGEETTSTIQIGDAASLTDLDIPYHRAGIDGGGQLLAVVDSGISLDAADLSDTRVSAGAPGPAHRKVEFYGTALAFGGSGDASSCDDPINGSLTHGHGVAAIALGNATDVDPQSYGAPFRIADPDDAGLSFAVDGVAPRARLIAYDAQTTPPVGNCDSALIDPGDLGALLADGHLRGARSFNLSWGAPGNAYGADAFDVDRFLEQQPDAALVVSVGNDGADIDDDTIPDPATLSDPGTAKNVVSVGASRTLGDLFVRAHLTSSGPAPGGRVAPLVLAPGLAPPGDPALYTCGSDDNDQADPVRCQRRLELAGTSYAAAAVSGAVLLIRDYFEEGFYPDGTDANPGNASDRVDLLSGAAIRAALVASAEMIGIDFSGASVGGDLVTRRERFNNEQGYGRVQLDRLLPLAGHAASPSGLLVHDGAGNDPTTPFDIPGLSASLAPGATTSGSFELCDDGQPLRIALAWIDPVDGIAAPEFLVNDLDLELHAPAATTASFIGNFFDDDVNDSGGVPEAQEDCLTPGLPDAGAWSVPIDSCPPTLLGESGVFDPFDHANPTEGIFVDPADLVPGSYTLTVRHNGLAANPAASAQSFAVVVAGGVCDASSVRFDRARYVCNDDAGLRVVERADAGDPLNPLDAGDVSSRLTVEVLGTDVCSNDCDRSCTVDADCPGGSCEATRVCDSEPATVSQTGLRFDGSVALSGLTAYDPGNGVLDVRDGDRLRVSYQDDDGASPPAEMLRTSEAEVDCRVPVTADDVLFFQIGRDRGYDIVGGCERNARGLFDYDAPDLYMDAGEFVAYSVVFRSRAEAEVLDLEARLRCVLVGPSDAPVDCPPGSVGCHPDPERLQNAPCPPEVEIVRDRRTVQLPPDRVTATSFRIRIDEALDAAPDPSPTVEMILELTAPATGHTGVTRIANRHRLNVDESSIFYSTDYPTGGSELRDVNNNDLIEQPTTDISGDVRYDYIFENRTFGDLTAGGTKNLDIQAPWDFDRNDGAFRSGLNALSDYTSVTTPIANWGEDLDFSGTMTGYCAANPAISCNRFPFDPANCSITGDNSCEQFEDRLPTQPNALLDQNWSADGGCGWQSDNTTATCVGGGPTVQGRACFDDGDCVDAGNPVLAGTCSGAAPTGGGIWHTGAIGEKGAGPDCAAECALLGVIPGEDDELNWWELLLTPVVHKVDTSQGPLGEESVRVEITDWAWNQSIDLPDNNAYVTIELDTDTADIQPVSLIADERVLNVIPGNFGAAARVNDFSFSSTLSGGFGLFAPLRPSLTDPSAASYNGTRGNNRVGANSCFFEESASLNPVEFPFDELGLAGPADDDVINGYCDVPGTTRHSCSLVCSLDDRVRCSLGVDCSGTCDAAGFCTNAPALECSVDGDCAFGSCVDADPLCAGAPCLLGSGSVDQYVTANGPLRNFDIRDFNGPDLRVFTLEDLYGPTGESFQGAIGLLSFEGNTGSPATPGFGLAIDDMVLEWREIGLVADAVDCASGECASLQLDVAFGYEGQARLGISLHDRTPYQQHCATSGRCVMDDAICNGPGSCADPADRCVSDVCFGAGDCTSLDCVATSNDCDDDGWYLGAGDVGDCDGDGTPDVKLRVSSDSDAELAYLALSGTPGLYEGSIPLSSSFDVPGVLFVRSVQNPFFSPTIDVEYEDLDDGAGAVCQNHVDPDRRGVVSDSSRLALTVGSIVVTGYTMSDNGDDDGFADDFETVSLFLEVANKTGIALDDVTVRVVSNDPRIDCVLDDLATIGRMEIDETRSSTDPVRLRMAEIARSDVDALLAAELTAIATSNEIHTSTSGQQLELALDLDFTGGTGPTTFFEGFEGGAIGNAFAGTAFELNDIDAIGNSSVDDAPSPAKSDGFRCTYSDPDWINANDPGRISCYLDQWNNATERPYATPTWRVTDLSQATGRAYSGTKAASFSLDIAGVPDSTTTPFASLEAIEMVDPINLAAGRFCSTSGLPCDSDAECPGGACEETTPTLRFKHQVSFGDSRTVSLTIGEAADRGVAHAQHADAAGAPVGDWLKLQPVQNLYDQQGQNNYFNCMFDPIDDGNNEDSFFDPLDPDRNNGPSSTCFPEFVWVHLGSTAGPYLPDRLGNAEGPGLVGAGIDPIGTWVESVVPLNLFRGRRVRLRFLATSLELGALGVHTWEQAFAPFNPDPGEDGWFIDDVTVTGALTTPGTLSVDTNDNSGLPGCGDTCTTVTAQLVAAPTSTIAGGRPVALDASSSVADRCIDGTLQYRFWSDGNADGLGGDPSDTLLRDWTDLPTLRRAPPETVSYVVDVRCSADPSCSATTALTVPVGCPSSGNLGGIFATVTAPSRTTLDLGGSVPYTFAIGELASLSSYTVGSTGSGSGSSFDISGVVADSWFLFKSAGSGTRCNEVATWRSGGAGESLVPGRDAVLP